MQSGRSYKATCGWLGSPWFLIPTRPHPPEPMQPTGRYSVDCGCFRPPWAFIPQPLQPPSPVQPERGCDASYSWLSLPWAFTPQLPQPLEPTQPPYFQASPPTILENSQPRRWLSWCFPLRPGEAPVLPMRQAGRGRGSPDRLSLHEMDLGEQEAKDVGFPPAPAAPPCRHCCGSGASHLNTSPADPCRPLQGEAREALEESVEGDAPASTDACWIDDSSPEAAQREVLMGNLLWPAQQPDRPAKLHETPVGAPRLEAYDQSRW